MAVCLSQACSMAANGIYHGFAGRVGQGLFVFSGNCHGHSCGTIAASTTSHLLRDGKEGPLYMLCPQGRWLLELPWSAACVTSEFSAPHSNITYVLH